MEMDRGRGVSTLLQPDVQGGFNQEMTDAGLSLSLSLPVQASQTYMSLLPLLLFFNIRIHL